MPPPTPSTQSIVEIRRTIAILLPSLAGGGAERVMLDLAIAFQRMGYRILFFVCRLEGELLDEAESQFEVIDLEAARGRNTLRPLMKAVSKHKPNALLVAMWPLTSIAVVATKISRTNCHCVVSDHNILSIQYDGWGVMQNLAMRISIAATYRFADGCVGVSDGVASDIARLALLRRDRVKVINNPIKTPKLKSTSEIEMMQLPWKDPPTKRILAAGKFKKVKNYPLLIDAFEILLRRVDSQLILLGDGHERNSLETLVRKKRLSNSICMPGFCNDLTPYYQTADLFVVSSNNEGFGNVIVEAMACGTPVVSTDCPTGPREILDNGRFGTLVPTGDPEALAEAMEQTLACPETPATLVKRANAFLPEIAATRYAELLFPHTLL